jgi:putative NADPH-quinone reductase
MNVLILQGHPDAHGGHFCHALADAYSAGAREGGHTIDQIEVAKLDFPLLRSADDFERGEPPESIRQAQLAISRCDHLVLLYPVWNSAIPALLKGFLEQTFRPTFIFPDARPSEQLGFMSAIRQRKALRGKTGRVVVTMKMPAFIYRWYFRPKPEKTTLGLAGVGPIRDSLIGRVDSRNSAPRRQWLTRMRELGRDGR